MSIESVCFFLVPEECSVPTQGATSPYRSPHRWLSWPAVHRRMQPHHPLSREYLLCLLRFVHDLTKCLVLNKLGSQTFGDLYRLPAWFCFDHTSQLRVDPYAVE